ncbi:aldo/keto reductase [Allosalinactinospora lopnorensis]|uniref:aldo/keto reductase n=1 Tax=Allosalinactinospora lopnorensis TaxID=1352348 RepID=UPI000623DF9A|nr:aldo/keto reductase [Allosalinactinospora lopnorensis]
MHYNQLGTTGLQVSAVSFGTAPLGDMFGGADETEAAATVHRALDAGVNFFDSSVYYGGGLAEQRLGAALRGRRDNVVIGTTDARHLDSAIEAEFTPIDEELLSEVLAATADVHAVSWSSGLPENNGGGTCSA